ncbi:MAG: acyltransferase family protein [Bowdeniella nasicola]|nr:acyltransferase family protein [Bowdeniella nasicola]
MGDAENCDRSGRQTPGILVPQSPAEARGQGQKFLTEIVWIRAISCLAVVAIHAVSWHQAQIGQPYHPTPSSVRYVYLTLTFGTPLFITISEILSARTNPRATRSGFLRNRFKYLGIPYLSMIVLYAAITSGLSIHERSFVAELVVNIFGLFNPYFVLIILQFAILHQLFASYLADANPWWVLTIAFGLNIIYLLPFNLYEAPSENIVVTYLWSTYYFYIFPAWIFYFIAGYYIGRNYDHIIAFLLASRVSWLIAPVIGLAVMFCIEYFHIVNEANSKRIDNIVYAMLAAAAIVVVSQRFAIVPWVIDVVSRHSFGIYLLHIPVLLLLGELEYPQIFSSGLIAIPFAFITSLLIALGITAVCNRVPYGCYVVGRLTPSARQRG